MSVDYDMTRQNGFTLVRARGVFDSPGGVTRMIDEVAAKVGTMREKRVLLDFREMNKPNLTLFDKYDIVSHFDKNNDQRRIKWALVVPPQRLKPVRDFETMITNRGYLFLAFSSMAEAESWLTH